MNSFSFLKIKYKHPFKLKEGHMWLNTIWNSSLFWWLLVAVLVAGVIIGFFLRRRYKVDPVKKHLDHYCRCYARGELSRDDFEELKQNLQEYKNSSIQQKKLKPNA